MTNSEAIEQLKMQMRNAEDCLIEDDVLEYLLSALEKNDKLKAEIEQLKSEIEQWQSTNLELVCELTRIECENNQLKSELEQSVKLPCKLKDTVYEVVKCDDGEVRIFEMKVCNVCEYGSFHNGSKKKFVWNIYMEDEKGFGYSYGTFYDFGKTIFLTREEAEQHLEDKQLKARIDADNVKKDFKEFCNNRDREESKLKFREVEE